MNASRRNVLKGLSLGAGSVLLPAMVRQLHAQTSATTMPKRFVFVLQNNGFQPWAAQPNGRPWKRENGPQKVVDLPLDDLELSEDLSPLAACKQRVTILQRLQGKHVKPFHGGGYGALSGAPKQSRPVAATIDGALAREFPGVFPMVGLGLAAAENNSTGTVYICSAWGPNMPIATQANPDLAFRQLFGSVAEGGARQDFNARSRLLDFMKDDVRRVRGELGGDELAKFDRYLGAFESMSDRQLKLAAMAKDLREHVPQRDERFTSSNEKERLETQFELAAASLVSGLTNVVTICSGLCNPNGSMRGMGVNIGLHQVGHKESDGDRDYRQLYTLLRKQHIELVAGLVRRLEAVPEGDGTMMDNTVIVYTSDAAETHHSSGNEWPFVLVGSLGGRLRAGRFIEYPAFGDAGNRSINALYCSLLHAAGKPREHFNLEGPTKEVDTPGPLTELLA